MWAGATVGLTFLLRKLGYCSPNLKCVILSYRVARPASVFPKQSPDTPPTVQQFLFEFLFWMFLPCKWPRQSVQLPEHDFDFVTDSKQSKDDLQTGTLFPKKH